MLWCIFPWSLNYILVFIVAKFVTNKHKNYSWTCLILLKSLNTVRDGLLSLQNSRHMVRILAMKSILISSKPNSPPRQCNALHKSGLFYVSRACSINPINQPILETICHNVTGPWSWIHPEPDYPSKFALKKHRGQSFLVLLTERSKCLSFRGPLNFSFTRRELLRISIGT